MHNNKLKDLQPEYRPYEKFKEFGPKALSDAELLAIILRTGSTENNSVSLSHKILSFDNGKAPSILNIFDYEISDLVKIKGVGPVKAIQIKALSELSLRIAQSSARKGLVFDDPEAIANYYMEQLRHEKQEVVVLLLLDSSCKLIKETILSRGTVNAALFSAREVFIEALKYEAVGIILLHNHPSGSPHPSVNDANLTKLVYDAGILLNIRLLDHIIIGDRNYYSFKKEERLNG